MYRENGLYFPVKLRLFIAQINWDQRRLPVVAADNVRLEVKQRHDFHYSAGEKAEALAVIHVAVQVGAVEVLLVVHEVIDNALML